MTGNQNAESIPSFDKANSLRPYRYVEYLLTELPKLRDDNGKMDDAKLCRNIRRIHVSGSILESSSPSCLQDGKTSESDNLHVYLRCYNNGIGPI